MSEQDPETGEYQILTRRDVKEALKAGIKEWMNENITSFGKWSLKSLVILAFCALVYGILITHGWKPPAEIIDAAKELK